MTILALRFGENDAIVQIEYDTTRQLLYTRSHNGSIYVYDLGEDGQGLTDLSKHLLYYCVRVVRHYSPSLLPRSEQCLQHLPGLHPI